MAKPLNKFFKFVADGKSYGITIADVYGATAAPIVGFLPAEPTDSLIEIGSIKQAIEKGLIQRVQIRGKNSDNKNVTTQAFATTAKISTGALGQLRGENLTKEVISTTGGTSTTTPAPTIRITSAKVRTRTKIRY
jgi:hypothetical protein